MGVLIGRNIVRVGGPMLRCRFPAYNEAGAIATVVRSVAVAAPWREIIVVDDGSTRRHRALARAAGAVVVRHPYNKGNGAAVKSGLRKATRGVLLILDGDGQHHAGGRGQTSSSAWGTTISSSGRARAATQANTGQPRSAMAC